MRRAREGFTIIELLVVTVLGGLILSGIFSVLVTTQRTYTAEDAKVQGLSARRAGSYVLFSELREISTTGGDLLAMGPDSVSVRVMRAYGLTCQVLSYGPTPALKVMKVGPWFTVGDSSFVFADNRADLSTDDRWRRVRISHVDTTQSCGTSRAQRLEFSGASSFAVPPDSVSVGAPVRAFRRFTYGAYTIDGVRYLGRHAPGQAPDPLAGPLATEQGLRFRYFDQSGAVTAVATAVRTIEITLKTASPVRTSTGESVSDSVTLQIHPRN